MKKSGKNRNNNSQKKKALPSSQNTKGNTLIDPSKRKTLSSLRNGSIALIVAGGTGTYFYTAYQTDLEERDLTKIGRGKPAIVQIHDPNCQLCTTLQKETRRALSGFNEENFEYLVANIRTKSGRDFATKHNAPHVTLLLFNRTGELQNVLQGVRQEEELATIFGNFIEKR